MNILKIAEVLESYSEDVLAYKLDGGFANAVTEAVSLLISQGEQIADLQNELRDERYRHDRVQDFEVAEAEELRKAREAQRWLPVTERLPVLTESQKQLIEISYLAAPEFNVIIKGAKKVTTLYFDAEGNWYDMGGTCYTVTHWMPLPEPPKEVQHDE